LKGSKNSTDFLNFIKNWINDNPIAFLGIIIGLILIILIAAIGLVKTIIVILLLFIGYWFGKNKDAGGALTKFLNKFLKKDK
jgi:uncharacterized membrane protein